MSHPTLGRLASRVKQPSAPPPLQVLLFVDGCMFLAVGVAALLEAPWWSVLIPLGIGTLVLVRHGRRAALAIGIRSHDQTPHGWLVALAMPGGLAGVLAIHAGRYGGLIIITYIALAQVGERVAWARFRPPRSNGKP